MAPSTKAIGKMINRRDRDAGSVRPDRFIKVNGTRVAWKEKECSSAQTEPPLQDNGQTEHKMATAIRSGPMGQSMKVTSQQDSKKDTVFSLSPTAVFTKENFETTAWKDTAIWFGAMERSMKVFGKRTG